MKFSYNWLQSHIAEPLPSPNEVAEKIIFHAFEVESVETVGADTVFDVKILPDRAHDCLSHRGLARELAALFGLKLKEAEPAALPTEALPVSVEVQSNLCRRYMATLIRGVKVGPSPAWMQERLLAIGARSINNIVDATNLVLFDLGQPVHAYDFAKIDKGVVVRPAHAGEQFITLSAEEKVLTEDHLLIADFVGALGLAGVKGGKTAEISEETTDILIEVANFDPTNIRKTARKLNLLTDAAKRFENDITPALVQPGMERAVRLILAAAGGSTSGVFDHYPEPAAPWTVTVPIAGVQRLLGSAVTATDIKKVFDAYGYTYTQSADLFTLTPPLERLDIKNVEDIAEEVGRFLGYDTLAPKQVSLLMPITQNQTFARIALARQQLTGQGYSEVMTYTFGKKGEVSIAYGPKDRSALRTNLLEGLRESYELNKANRELLNLKEVKLFEIGTVFFEAGEEIRVAMIDSNGTQEVKLEEFVKEIPEMLPVLPIAKSGVVFKLWSVYPYIVRDIAVWVLAERTAEKEKLVSIVLQFAKAHCSAGPFLFDTFTKEGKTSLAYRFIFQSYEKTLTDAEVNEVFKTLQAELAQAGFEIR